MDDILDRAGKRLAGNYRQAGGHAAALSVDFRDLLIGLARDLLLSCLNSGTPAARVKQLCERGGLFARLRIRPIVSEALYREYGPGGWRQKGGPEVVDALLRSGAESTAEEIEALAAVEV